MTDGTSQGLFIVVAIVIFGIFVVMAYILFEDTLSPALANIFTTSSEQTEANLKDNSLIQAKDFKLHRQDVPNAYTDLRIGRDSITYRSNGESYIHAPYIPSNLLVANTKYILTYDITDLSGTVETLGGHSYLADEQAFYIDGTYMGRYHTGAKYPMDGETHQIRVEFYTNDYEVFESTEDYQEGLAIHPNRHYNEIVNGGPTVPRVPAYKVRIDNIKLIRID